jgi:hypothetical protein
VEGSHTTKKKKKRNSAVQDKGMTKLDKELLMVETPKEIYQKP